MNEEQMVKCAHALMRSAEEDSLGFEDLAIFLDGASMGKYGKIYTRLDQEVVFQFLEQYREQRHEEILKLREEQAHQIQGFGPGRYDRPAYKPDPIDKEHVSSMLNEINRLYGNNDAK